MESTSPYRLLDNHPINSFDEEVGAQRDSLKPKTQLFSSSWCLPQVEKKRKRLGLLLLGVGVVVVVVVVVGVLLGVTSGKSAEEEEQEQRTEVLTQLTNDLLVNDGKSALLNSTSLLPQLWQPLSLAFSTPFLLINQLTISQCHSFNCLQQPDRSFYPTSSSAFVVSKNATGLVLRGKISKLLGLPEVSAALFLLATPKNNTEGGEGAGGSGSGFFDILRVSPQVVLQLSVPIDWQIGRGLSLLNNNNTNNSTTVVATTTSSLSWLPEVKLLSGGSVVVSSFEAEVFSLDTDQAGVSQNESLERGLNVFLHQTSLNLTATGMANKVFQDVWNLLFPSPSSSDWNTNLSMDLKLKVPAETDAYASATLSLNATLEGLLNNQQGGGGVVMGSIYSTVETNFTLTVLCGGNLSAPVLGMKTSLGLNLGSLHNPNIPDFKLRGDFQSDVGVFVLTGIIESSKWIAPFGATWLKFGDVNITLVISSFNNNNNNNNHPTSPLQALFNTSATVTLPSSSSIPATKSHTVVFSGSLQGLDLVFVGEGLSVGSFPRMIADLAGLKEGDIPPLDDVLAIAENIDVSLALSNEEGSFPLYYQTQNPNQHAQLVTVGKGLTLRTKVDAGEIIDQITSVFSLGDVGETTKLEFEAGVLVPIFELPMDPLDFKDKLEIYITTRGANEGLIRVSDNFEFLGFSVLARPFKTAPSLVASMEARITLSSSSPSDVFLLYVSGELDPSGFTLGGSLLGTWNNAFGIRGLDVGNVSLEVSLVPGPTGVVLSGIGIAGSLDLGSTEADLRLAASLPDLTDLYLYANIQHLSLTDLLNFVQTLNTQSLSGVDFNAEEWKAVTELIDFDQVRVLIAPSSGDLQGIKYEKGFAVTAEVTLFLSLKVSASVQLVEREVGLSTTFQDLVLGFQLEFASGLEDAVIALIEFLFPGVDLDPVNLGPFLIPEDIFSIKRIGLQRFSLYDILHGELPVFSLVVVIAGQEKTFSTDMNLNMLTQSFLDILEKDVFTDPTAYSTDCITDLQCTDNPDTPKCDHTLLPWTCTPACPPGALDLPATGCFLPPANLTTTTTTLVAL